MIPVVEVWVDDARGLRRAGTAYFMLRSSSISTRFAYDSAYLSDSRAIQISPDLPLGSAGGYCQDIPLAFRDSAPDRWGRRLMNRKAQLSEGSSRRQLDEVDYLLGVSDEVRQGALRYKSPDGAWLGEDGRIPPAVDLPKLIAASRSVLSDEEAHEELKLLLDAGSSSLGGARPKATVQDGDALYLAKFSRDADEWDVRGLEKTVLDLMSLCGIETPGSRLVRFGNHAVLMVERFDRENGKVCGPRVLYLSAMSLLGLRDGQQAQYLDLIDQACALCGQGVIEQFLRRVAASIAANNTDDHLRNHGFVFQDGKWRLSPCFDVTVNPYEARRQTSILGGNADEGSQLRELAGFFGVTGVQFTSLVKDVRESFTQFEKMAQRNGVQKRTISLVHPRIERGISLLDRAIRATPPNRPQGGR